MNEATRKLWEINEALEATMFNVIDRDTGEITDEGLLELDKLEVEKDAKCLAVAAYIKGLRYESQQLEAMANAIKSQATTLLDRSAVHEGQCERLTGYLERNMTVGKKLEDARSQITWRKSEAVIITDESALLKEFTNTTVTVKPAKSTIKDALKRGTFVKGAHLEQRNNMKVK